MSIISTEKEYVELIHPSVVKARRQTYLKRGVLGEKLPLVIPITLEGFEAEINGLIQGDFSEQFKKRLTLQKWHENGETVTYQDIEEAKTGVIEELRKPIEGARYARVNVHFIEKNSDTLVLRWNPSLGKWNRLILPATLGTYWYDGILITWHQKRGRYSGVVVGANPWSLRGVHFSDLSIGTHRNNYGGTGFGFLTGNYANRTTDRRGGYFLTSYCYWSHDKINHVFSYIFYLDNDNEEHSPNVLYDDDETFWSAYNEGSGSVQASLAEETTTKTKGTSSLKVSAISGSYLNIGCQHDWGATYQNWSTYDFLCLYLYGSNSGKTFQITILDSAGNWRRWDIVDNWSGWRRHVLPLRTGDAQSPTAPDLSAIKIIRIQINNPSAGAVFYLDRTLIDVGKWVKVEIFVPDYIKNASDSVKLYFWDPGASDWATPATFNGEQNSNPNWAGSNIYVLNGQNFDTLYGTGQNKFTFYGKGGRGETVSHALSTAEDPDGTITYGSVYGCKKRIGFAIYMPPDDGRDSSTYGISQCKLKLEVYYDKGEFGFWGEATYEFEDSTNTYYGLRNINKPYIALWHNTEKRANFIVLPNITVGDGLPSRLEVTADENEDIVKVVIGWASQKTGDLRYGLDLTDPTLDSDGDGIPDVIENIESYVGGLS